MVERCVEYTPKTRLAYLVHDETFGMRKMFDNYGFSVDLVPLPARRTSVTIVTHYTPRNPIYSAMNATFLRRQFRTFCQDLADGLQAFAESWEATATH